MIGDNYGSISHLLRTDTIDEGSILLTDNLIALKRGNSEPILIVKRTEWSKFIDYFSLSIEANPSRVGKKNVYFVHIGSIPRTPYGNLHITRQQLDKEFN